LGPKAGANANPSIMSVVVSTFLSTCAKLTIFLFGIAASLTTVKVRKPPLKQIQTVHCPTCGAGPGEKCELTSGRPRTKPHRDRRLIAADCDGTSIPHCDGEGYEIDTMDNLSAVVPAEDPRSGL